eukprot:m.242414 g.242414  ORF g.242414 m.242414 type:complete len:426 (+) comp14033_c0_seq1:782-2059(+)
MPRPPRRPPPAPRSAARRTTTRRAPTPRAACAWRGTRPAPCSHRPHRTMAPSACGARGTSTASGSPSCPTPARMPCASKLPDSVFIRMCRRSSRPFSVWIASINKWIEDLTRHDQADPLRPTSSRREGHLQNGQREASSTANSRGSCEVMLARSHRLATALSSAGHRAAGGGHAAPIWLRVGGVPREARRAGGRIAAAAGPRRHVAGRQQGRQHRRHALAEHQAAGGNDIERRKRARATAAPHGRDQRTHHAGDAPVRVEVHADAKGDRRGHVVLPLRAEHLDDGQRCRHKKSCQAERKQMRRQRAASNHLGHVQPEPGGGHLELGPRDRIRAVVDVPGRKGKCDACDGSDELGIKLRARRSPKQQAGLEVQHHVAGLRGAALGNAARHERRGHAVRADPREDELRQLADAADRVHIGLPQGADC